MKTVTYPSKLKFNDADVYQPDVLLWEKGYWIAGPSETFSKRVIDIYERLLKELVNDWSAAQTDND